MLRVLGCLRGNPEVGQEAEGCTGGGPWGHLRVGAHRHSHIPSLARSSLACDVGLCEGGFSEVGEPGGGAVGTRILRPHTEPCALSKHPFMRASQRPQHTGRSCSSWGGRGSCVCRLPRLVKQQSSLTAKLQDVLSELDSALPSWRGERRWLLQSGSTQAAEQSLPV